MATTTIGWGDGSGDNIYLTYPSASGDQTVSVSSDANTGAARTKTVTFTALASGGGPAANVEEDLSSLYELKRSIISTGEWANQAANSTRSVILPIKPGYHYRVDAQPSVGAIIAVLSSEDTHTGDAVFASGYTSRISISENDSYEFVAPSDAAYLYALKYDTSGTYMLPSAYMLPYQTLTVNQDAGLITETVVLHVSGYIDKSVDGAWQSISNPSNAYTTADDSDYSQVALTRGKNAYTYIYWTFDTSSIPANATIDSISCMAKLYVTNLNASYVQSAGAKMCSGTTEKTDSVLVNTTTARRTFTMGTWTRSDLNDVRLKMYATRSTGNTSSSYYLRLYGANLTITYTYTPSNP